MHPAFDSLEKSFAEALGGLSAVQAQAHLSNDPKQWSVQQVIEHLLLTYRSTMGALEERLQKGRPTQAPVTPEHTAIWQKTIGAGRFPGGQKSPERVDPEQAKMTALSGGDLASLVKSDLEQMDGLLDQCAEKFGSQPMASHFVFGPLSADQWRQFHEVHGRHHLAQALRILSSVVNS